MDTEWPIRIVVFGKAAPAGSKRQITNRHTGQSFIIDANKNAKPWKKGVADAAAAQYRGPVLSCAVDIEMIFVMQRPKGHYGTGRNAEVLKDNAPLQPTVAPDVLKLARGVEDALSTIVYRDDAQIVNESLQKRYGDRERVEIRVRPTAFTCVRDLVMMGVEKPTRPTELMPWEQLTLVA
jgi:Holliday junction resolvase RusA-like endonuclease